MGDATELLTVQQVLSYLQENPDFFMEQPEALESLQLSTSPQGTISLAQRQTERLQAKNEQMFEQLHALIDNARQNDELQSRVHQLCLQLMDAESFDALLSMIMSELKKEFSADEVALCLFYTGDTPATLPELADNIAQLHADDDSLKIFDGLLAKQQPVCGRLTKAQKSLLFVEHADQVHSVACLPLGHAPCAGLLAIASHDANRFHADMATDYLSFLGEVIMRLLRPYSHHQHGE